MHLSKIATPVLPSETDSNLPANFQFVRVIDVAPLGTDFLRLTLQGTDLSSHDDTSIHFRLVQPPKGNEPEWPSVNETGTTLWPDGPIALHKPVYTTRAIDHVSNRLILDIFIHEGGRTIDWAQGINDGTDPRICVGLSGPVGGGLMQADRVLMASDETGFPAAARILEGLPVKAKGEVFLETKHGADCRYPIDAPKGVKITWLARERSEDFLASALQALPQHTESKIWLAGEREDARILRDAAKASGRVKEDLRISGFWRR